MTRQQKRKEIRDLEKEYKKITTNKDFQKLLQSDEFRDVPAEELELLKKKEHEDKAKQARFNIGSMVFARLMQIQQRTALLKLKKEDTEQTSKT